MVRQMHSRGQINQVHRVRYLINLPPVKRKNNLTKAMFSFNLISVTIFVNDEFSYKFSFPVSTSLSIFLL